MFKKVIIISIMLNFSVVYGSQVINGVLIEGLDYSGKTTIAKILKKKLEEKSYNIRTGHGMLGNSELSVFLASLGYDSLPTEVSKTFPDAKIIENKVKLHFAGLIVDKILSNQKLQEYIKQEIFLIQDRYFLTLKCAKMFFIPNLEIPELKIFEQDLIPFKLNIYLTCNLYTRKKRIQSREKEPDRLEKYLIAHLGELYKYDDLCQSMIKEKPEWYIIDTSNKKPEEIADQILDLIEKVEKNTQYSYKLN